MGERPLSVAAAIITYNRREVLRESLSALMKQTRPVDQIFVIDNASFDHTPEMVAQEFPSVCLVRLSENTGAAGGFAAGINEAVARGHDWVWVFNDDDTADLDALWTMLETVHKLPAKTGIVACGRRNAGGRLYPLGAHWNHHHVALPPIDPEGPAVPVDVVTFSGTLVSAEMVHDVGVPKGEFFMMIEDLEYCLRVRRAGWEIYVLPKPLATALAMGSEGLSPPWRGYYQTRNQLAMTLEHRSPWELYWWLVRTTKFCLGAIQRRDRPVTRIRLRMLGVWHAIRGVSGRTVPPTSSAAN
jgi:rhamnopyranosyl-N-acetylglucosaminyl-diphospho-decaprenol beta-1,3/1,4-galactofuranosyltransferase